MPSLQRATRTLTDFCSKVERLRHRELPGLDAGDNPYSGIIDQGLDLIWHRPFVSQAPRYCPYTSRPTEQYALKWANADYSASAGNASKMWAFEAFPCSSSFVASLPPLGRCPRGYRRDPMGRERGSLQETDTRTVSGYRKQAVRRKHPSASARWRLRRIERTALALRGHVSVMSAGHPLFQGPAKTRPYGLIRPRGAQVMRLE